MTLTSSTCRREITLYQLCGFWYLFKINTDRSEWYLGAELTTLLITDWLRVYTTHTFTAQVNRNSFQIIGTARSPGFLLRLESLHQQAASLRIVNGAI